MIYLRMNYHFGPQKISMYLHRYHDVTVSPSGVWRKVGYPAQITFKLSLSCRTARTRHWAFGGPGSCMAADVPVSNLATAGLIPHSLPTNRLQFRQMGKNPVV